MTSLDASVTIDHNVWIPLTDSDTSVKVSFRLINAGPTVFLVAFSSKAIGEHFLQQTKIPFYKIKYSRAVDMFATVLKSSPNISGFVIDPDTENERVTERSELITHEKIDTSSILSFGSLLEIAPESLLISFCNILKNAGVSGAKGAYVVKTDMSRIWIIGIPNPESRAVSQLWQQLTAAADAYAPQLGGSPDIAITNLSLDKLTNDFGCLLQLT